GHWTVGRGRKVDASRKPCRHGCRVPTEESGYRFSCETGQGLPFMCHSRARMCGFAVVVCLFSCVEYPELPW
ncbi:unnamed protein product, partial [Urochloa humidicola]